MCIQPIQLPLKEQDILGRRTIKVKCGKCYKCKKFRASGWMLRLLMEQRRHTNAHFVTLTYDPRELPFTKAGHMTLDPKAPQLFMKRLRKHIDTNYDNPHPIKSYLCGEYGDRYHRPHYHAIIYGLPFGDFTTDDLTLIWKKGLVDVGTVTPKSIAYVANYIMKGTETSIKDGIDDRVPQFQRMSKHLGDNYITPGTIKFHNETMSMLITAPDKRQYLMPRYYRERIFSQESLTNITRSIIKQAEEADNRRFLEDQEWIKLQRDIWSQNFKSLYQIKTRAAF